MITDMMGVAYSRGACAVPRDDGPARAPQFVRQMRPELNWTIVTPGAFDGDAIMADRFGENAAIQKEIYNATPHASHILIGGDHSVNFGHFAALADRMDDDLCLIYIEAHLDMHTPESSRAQASGAPHGANVRALCGDGDKRWHALQKRCPALKPENLFYLASRSWEPAEIDYVREHNIFMRTADTLQTPEQWRAAADEIMRRIGDRPYVVSFDLDAIDPSYFRDVWVPAPNGITPDAAVFFVQTFAPHAHGFEFVEYAPTADSKSAAIFEKLLTIALTEGAC